MKENGFQKALREGRVPIGHMLWEFATRGMAKIAATAGLDFVIIDMEHSAFDTAEAADLIAWFKATEVAPFVRVPQGLYHFLARAMDAGALGVLRVLEAIRTMPRPPRFYQAWSSEMYGRVTETPQSERTPFYPRSP